MPDITIHLGKMMIARGKIVINADGGAAAANQVRADIISGRLQTNDDRIEWDMPEYADGTFDVLDYAEHEVQP